ncbi:MAG: fatty acid desaturase [Turneriella sp.]|nr:fatty acid desaturase [Turneriella sp.]
MLRYKADILSVFYMIVTTALLIVNWNLPEFNVWLFSASILMATSCFAMAHNHNHVPMWRVDFLNKLTDYWLTLFYGFPVYAWIPTHNMNHHQLNNREGDYTITWRLSEKNNLLTMITFPIISAIYQQKPTENFLKHYWRTNKPRFFYYISQYVVWVLWIAGAFYLNAWKAWLYVGIPMLVATQFVLIINYIQHVHTDEESQYNHSRNFTGIYSKFLLNNGLHTAHHDQMGLHWSQLPAAHEKIKHLIDPSLNQRSLGWYVIRTYLLAPLIPAFRSKSMRLERMALAGGGTLEEHFDANNHMTSASAVPKAAKKAPKAKKAKGKKAA